MTEEIYSGLIHLYNCNNCEYINECEIERVDYEKNCDLRQYFCFNHSHFS